MYLLTSVSPISSILTLLVIALVLLFIIRKPREEFHSHWNHLLPNFKFSTREFYTLFKKELESHDIEAIKYNEVSLKTGNIGSAYRLYLRIKWRDYHYDLCLAPFGDGCFVSWWLIFDISPTEEFISKIPFVGSALQKIFYRQTFYKIDTASMFMTYAHQSVLKVIDDITKGSGIRIELEDRKPKLNDIFKR